MALNSPINYQEEFGDVKVKCNRFRECRTGGISSDRCPVCNTGINCYKGTVYLDWAKYIVLNGDYFSEI